MSNNKDDPICLVLSIQYIDSVKINGVWRKQNIQMFLQRSDRFTVFYKDLIDFTILKRDLVVFVYFKRDLIHVLSKENPKYSWFIHKPKVFLVYSQRPAKCFILEPTGTPEMVLEAMCSET